MLLFYMFIILTQTIRDQRLSYFNHIRNSGDKLIISTSSRPPDTYQLINELLSILENVNLNSYEYDYDDKATTLTITARPKSFL